MKAAGVTKPRKDAVMGIEIVFSLPPELSIDDKAYFSDCTAWTGAYFGGVQNILSADIHRDEAAPHCHVLLLPLIDGRLNGSGLVGNKQKLMAMQTQFHQGVAARYGLRKAPARLSSPAKLAASTAVFERMRQTGDKALQSAAWPSIRAGIENDPRPFLLTMGIEVATPKKKLKSMAEIFTGKGKGAQLETKRIGFAAPANDRTLCSVGFTSEKLTAAARADLRPALPAANNAGLEQADIAPLPPIETETTHIRDIDLDPARYDENGDYCPMPLYCYQLALCQDVQTHRTQPAQCSWVLTPTACPLEPLSERIEVKVINWLFRRHRHTAKL
jgi:hypothetical protein